MNEQRNEQKDNTTYTDGCVSAIVVVVGVASVKVKKPRVCVKRVCYLVGK